MKNSLAKFIVFVLIAMNGCCAAPRGSDVEMWKPYRVDIPHFVVEFLIPPELKQGYAPFRTEVSFENPEKDRFLFSLGNGIFRKAVGGFYLGARGDFSDWDLTTEIFIIKCNRNQRSMHSTEELIEFVRTVLTAKYTLVNGQEVEDPRNISIEKIGPHDVVVERSINQTHIRELKLKGNSGVTFYPYQCYYIRLDGEVTVGIRVSHDNEKRLNPKWYAESHARITKIIENMKVEPKKSDN